MSGIVSIELRMSLREHALLVRMLKLPQLFRLGDFVNAVELDNEWLVKTRTVSKSSSFSSLRTCSCSFEDDKGDTNVV
jgi:hypothetical protein